MNIQPLTVQDLPYINHLQPEGWADISVAILEYCLQHFCYPRLQR